MLGRCDAEALEAIDKMRTENIDIVGITVMEKIPNDFDARPAGSLNLLLETREVIHERLFFDKVPAEAITACSYVPFEEPGIVGFGEYVMAGRRDEVEPTAARIAMRRAFKSSHEIALKRHTVSFLFLVSSF